jgi:DNA-directed RNA polymerase subunit RPC12/RpoP
MNCPNCNTEIDHVNVFSQCWQKADINEQGNITDYGSIEDIMDTQGIECPECHTDITDKIKELS